MKKDLNTEDKIKQAAKTIFLTKGFDGCTTREIAQEAGINVALLNYYFRSKEMLFKMIFESAMNDFIESMLQVFSSQQSLENKMRIFIEKEYEFLTKHKELPAFIINEINRFDACSFDHSSFIERIAATGIFDECKLEQEKGNMRKIDLISITLLIMSNSQYPILARNLMVDLHKINHETYDQQLLLHKQYVTEMLINYLFYKS